MGTFARAPHMGGFFALAATLMLASNGVMASGAAPLVSGAADPANIVVDGRARFTVVTPTLLRLEYAEDGAFEDRASFFAVHRDTPPQKFTHTSADGWLTIETERLRLKYKSGAERFAAENLTITSLPRENSAKLFEWRPGQPNGGNLGGTLRTLDGCRGPMDLGQGVLSRDGWFLLDDSTSVLLEAPDADTARQEPRPPDNDSGLRTQDSGLPWAKPRPSGARLDWYFFGYGDDYAAALRALTTIGGRIPLPPKFAFGSWYSRYWPYRADQLVQICDDYRRFQFPLDVLVIDMDWHLDGWTGYTWNPALIPDPEGLLKELHARGVKVTLNLHPADGVGSQEKAYPEFARALGVDPDSKRTIPFDIADPKFARNYFDLLLHPLERQGVDFWWMDWQQSRTTSIAGLDPLPWLNYLHFHDRQRAREGEAGGRASPVREGEAGGREGEAPAEPHGAALRGLCFSRWGGWGDHRHPIQFSGDAESSWKVLKFELPFTATAGNVGAAYWSHDLGGHWSAAGRVDPELFVRWLQFGAFSPVMRVHSTRDAWNDRRPWLYDRPFTDAAREAYDLRYRLMPYIYTMARKCYETGMPLVRPMYLRYPRDEHAYELPGEFMFGDDILVAPVTEPGYGRARIADVRVWFPPGDWYDLTTHEHYRGPREALVSAALDHIPAFARGGAPLPMNPRWVLTCQRPADPLIVRLYPAAAGAPGEPAESGMGAPSRIERELYEDDGETIGYLKDEFRLLALTGGATPGGEPMATIGPSRGTYAGAPAARPDITLELPALARPRTVALGDGRGRSSPGNLAWSYDPSEMLVMVGLGETDAASLERETKVHWVVRSDQERMLEARRARSLALQIERGLAQLPSDHPEAAALFDAHRQITAYYTSLADPAGVGAEGSAEGIVLRTRVESAVRNAVDHLMKLGGPDENAAIRTLTGTSLNVSVVPGPDPATVRVQAVVQRPPAAARSAEPEFTVRLKRTDLSEAALARLASFDAHGAAHLDFDIPSDPTRLTIVRGMVTAEPPWQNAQLKLAAPFEWNGARIADWMVVGPLPGGKGPDAERLGPEEKLDLSAAYPARDGGQVRWMRYRVKPVEVVDGFSGVVNFRALYNVDNATAFATTTIAASNAATVDLLFRHDDGALVWVNSQEVYRATKPRALYDGEARIPATLTAGENTILVKVDQQQFNWGFVMSVAPHGEEKLPELHVRLPER